jgi:hypothetical protein
MRLSASYIPFSLAGVAIVLALAILAATSPSDPCSAQLCQPRTPMTLAANEPMPTLAPPRNSVLVRVEVDEPGVEIGWADGP